MVHLLLRVECEPPPTQNMIASMFTSWNASYPHRTVSKSIWHKVWIATPKYVCWKIWLARNEIIFNKTELPATKATEQEKKLLLETLNHSTVKEDNSLRSEERAWLEDYTGKARCSANKRPIHKERWQICEPEDNFHKWWKSQDKCTIFFDGASKGNPGMARAGGVIFFQNGKKEEFSWGLGLKINNQAEILRL